MFFESLPLYKFRKSSRLHRAPDWRTTAQTYTDRKNKLDWRLSDSTVDLYRISLNDEQNAQQPQRQTKKQIGGWGRIFCCCGTTARHKATVDLEGKLSYVPNHATVGVDRCKGGIWRPWQVAAAFWRWHRHWSNTSVALWAPYDHECRHGRQAVG